MRKTPPGLELTKEEKTGSIAKLKPHLSELFDIDAGNLQTEMVLDFISKHIGLYYYNKGVLDSMAAMSEKIEDLYLLIKDDE